MVGYRDYNVQWNLTENSEIITRRNLRKLMRKIQKKHGDGDNGDVSAENTFDILLDASQFYHPGHSTAGHPGSHVEVLERIIAHPDFQPWLHNVIRLYNHTDPNKPVIKILIIDRDGDKEAVACAIILQYCLNLLGFEAGTCGFIRHLSKDHFWKKHCRRCINCRYPEQQPRFKEVMDVAARRLFAMMQ